MKIIKSNSYNFINAEPFDIPIPLQFELYSGNTLLVEYIISAEGAVNYSFNPNTVEKILTSTKRALDLKDIYFLFLSRVVPEHSPYVGFELKKYGIKEYNPYEIIRKSHAFIPGDNYWIRFADQDLNYKKAIKEFHDYNEKAYRELFETQKAYFEKMSKPEPVDVSGEVESILHQKDIDFDNLSHSIKQKAESDVVEAVCESNRDFENTMPVESASKQMSDDEISEMMKKVEGRVETVSSDNQDDGGVMSDDAIAALLAANSTPEPAADPNAKMSDDAIAAMFAANSTPEPAADPNAKMSDDAIAAMFAANSTPEPAADPNAKMSDDAIAAMFAANSTPEPAADPNAKMSDDAIAAMFAANSTPEPAADPNAKMSDDAIAAMFAANSTPESAADPNAKMSDDAIAAMFAANSTPEPAADPNAKMSDDAIAAMFAANSTPEPTADPNAKMSDDAIAAMFAANSTPEPAADPNAKMSDDAIAAMFAAAQN